MWLERSVVEYTSNHSKISSASKIGRLKPLIMVMTSIRRRFIRQVDTWAAENPSMNSLNRTMWTAKQQEIYNCFYKSTKADAEVRDKY